MISAQISSAPVALPDSVPSLHQETAMLSSLPVDELINKLINTMVTFAINLGIAILVFYVGRMIINKMFRVVSNIFIRRKVDRSLATFVLSMVRIVLYFILIVIVIGILGIETSSFIAIFASAGVAIGMALSGTLQNFAGGVLILLLKPYKIGDFIEAQGYAGTVKEIQIFHTIITTGDNKAIIIPNGGLSTGSINNTSREDYRRIEWTVGISYGDSVDAAREKILEIIHSDSRIVRQYLADDRAERAEAEFKARQDAGEIADEAPATGLRRIFGRKKKSPKAPVPAPAAESAFVAKPTDCSPVVLVSNLGASSVDLTVRAWARTADYWGVYFTINERIYKELPEAGVSFPFPQLDVHTYTQN